MFFIDAAHFVLAPFLGYLWCFTRLFLKAPSGRQRFNVLGALNAITHELITITNETYINAQSVCDLLWKISRLNLAIPITFILDNARYQRCTTVNTLAAQLNLELIFLPPLIHQTSISLSDFGSLSKSNAYIQSTIQSLRILKMQSLTACRKLIRITNENLIHY